MVELAGLDSRVRNFAIRRLYEYIRCLNLAYQLAHRQVARKPATFPFGTYSLVTSRLPVLHTLLNDASAAHREKLFPRPST